MFDILCRPLNTSIRTGPGMRQGPDGPWGADHVTGGGRPLLWTPVLPSCLPLHFRLKERNGIIRRGCLNTRWRCCGPWPATLFTCVPGFRLVGETSQPLFRHTQPHSYPASLLALGARNHLDGQLTKSPDPSLLSKLLMGGFMNFKPGWRPAFKQTRIRTTHKKYSFFKTLKGNSTLSHGNLVWYLTLSPREFFVSNWSFPGCSFCPFPFCFSLEWSHHLFRAVTLYFHASIQQTLRDDLLCARSCLNQEVYDMISVPRELTVGLGDGRSTRTRVYHVQFATLSVCGG